jgi:hypothetical protein
MSEERTRDHQRHLWEKEKENVVFLSFKFCCLKDIAMANDLESGMQWKNKRVCHCLGKRSGSRIQ